MSYVVLARKWRPQQFADILGQDHVTRTITNAIESNRIAHAFLFSGPRGVGKTSGARILAKALCCESTGQPTATPCGQCRQCTEITEGRSTDVFEIDAASNTGIDNVREIIENVRYLPSSARFKIYVIDEVHMLSTGAFNALLKTLEEPPAHVKFILATTDVHKVPVTILSRCQRYDFRRISLGGIAERLSKILAEEGLDNDPSAMTLVAREAEGSMRDAQSLLEQVVAFAGGRRLDGALVREALGVVDGALVARAFELLFARDPGGLIELANEVYMRGLDAKRFADALVEEARDLLAAKWVRAPEAVIDRPKDEIDQLRARAGATDPVTLERLFEQLTRLVEDVARSSHPRFALEVGLAAIAEKPERVPLAQLLDKLTRVESQLAAIAPSDKSPVRRTQNDWRAGGRGPAQYTRSLDRGASIARAESAPSETVFRAGSTAEPPISRDDHHPEISLECSGAWSAPAVDPVGATVARQAEATRQTLPGSEGADAPSDEPRSGGAHSFAGFYEVLRKRRPSLAATLAQVRPLVFSPGTVVLGSETAFDEAKLAEVETRGFLESLLADYLGTKTVLEVRRTERAKPGSSSPATLIEVAEERQAHRRSEKSQAARVSASVKTVEDLLGATITRVRVIDEG